MLVSYTRNICQPSKRDCFKKTPDFDVLADEPEKAAAMLKREIRRF